MEIEYVPMEFYTASWWGTTAPSSACVVETTYTVMVPIVRLEALA